MRPSITYGSVTMAYLTPESSLVVRLGLIANFCDKSMPGMLRRVKIRLASSEASRFIPSESSFDATLVLRMNTASGCASMKGCNPK